jgi:drug/metabolite transporter (DMT)-like permease
VNRSFATGLAAALAAVIVWGVQLPIAKDAFVAVDPFHLTMVRYLIAVACLIPLLVAREGWGALSYRGGGLRVAALGVIGMCASPLMAFTGMALSSAEHIVVIGALQPSIAALGLWLFGRRRPERFTFVCILAAFVGVVLVVTKGSASFIETPRQVAGDLIGLVGAVCWVAYTVGVGRLSGWSTWRVTVLTMLPGALATVVVTQAMIAAGAIEVPSAAEFRSVAWELAYLSFVGVLLAMLGWNLAARRIGVLNSSLLINFMPVVTFAFRALQGHRIAAVEAAGAALVVAALIANNLYLRRQYMLGRAAGQAGANAAPAGDAARDDAAERG